MAAFDPYEYNGGTLVAIAGSNFAAIGSDTRVVSEFHRPSLLWCQQQQTVIKLADNILFGSVGCLPDAIVLRRNVQGQCNLYRQIHNENMSIPAVVEMLSLELYMRCFSRIPYFTNSVLAGIDGNGCGCAYRIGPLGFYEKVTYIAVGAANEELLPFLDNQVAGNNIKGGCKQPLTQDRALTLIKDSFAIASERNALSGDRCNVQVVRRTNTHEYHNFIVHWLSH